MKTKGDACGQCLSVGERCFPFYTPASAILCYSAKANFFIQGLVKNKQVQRIAPKFVPITCKINASVSETVPSFSLTTKVQSLRKVFHRLPYSVRTYLKEKPWPTFHSYKSECSNLHTLTLTSLLSFPLCVNRTSPGEVWSGKLCH